MNANTKKLEEHDQCDLRADEAMAYEARMRRAVADAVARGEVVDCTEDMPASAYWWLCVSRAAYEDCVAWTDAHAFWQEKHEAMRMQMLVDMCLHAVRVHHAEGDVATIRVLRIPRGGNVPELCELTMTVRDSWLIVSLPGETDPLSA